MARVKQKKEKQQKEKKKQEKKRKETRKADNSLSLNLTYKGITPSPSPVILYHLPIARIEHHRLV